MENKESLTSRQSSNESSRRCLLKDLNRDIFRNGLYPGVVELSGKENCGKSLMAYQIIVQALLPTNFGGCGSSILLIDTQHKFMMHMLLSMIQQQVGDISNSDDIDALNKCLDNLHIVKCFKEEDFRSTLCLLPNLVKEKPDISLVVVDSVYSYYWYESQTNQVSINDYLNEFLDIFKKVATESAVTVIYTRPSHFRSQNNTLRQELLSYQIELHRIDNKMYAIRNNSSGNRYTRFFRISLGGVLRFVDVDNNSNEAAVDNGAAPKRPKIEPPVELEIPTLPDNEDIKMDMNTEELFNDFLFEEYEKVVAEENPHV